jgi:hypothetical protein
MSRNTLLIIILTLFLIIVGGLVGGYFYLTNTKTTDAPTNTEITGSLTENGGGVTSTSSPQVSTSTTGVVIPKLRQLTTTPVAGYDFVDTAKGFVIWYVDRSNGNIYQTATSTLEATKITNTTIPKVYEAFIGKGGSNIILRTLDESGEKIQTFIGSPRASSTLSGIFTSDTISTLSLSPSKDSFFGMTGTASGLGNFYSWAGKATNAFSHPLKKWVPQWVNSTSIIMTSSPSAKTQNIAYILNTSTKAFTKLLGPKNGLVVSSSPSATKMLYSENKGNQLAFGVYDAKTATETSISNGTIPDKCVWSKKDTSTVYCGFPKNLVAGAYPDDWYQGKVSFSDSIRALNVNTFQFKTNENFESGNQGVDMDATNLMLSSNEKYLLFTNKKDLTLWMLEL